MWARTTRRPTAEHADEVLLAVSARAVRRRLGELKAQNFAITAWAFAAPKALTIHQTNCHYSVRTVADVVHMEKLLV